MDPAGARDEGGGVMAWVVVVLALLVAGVFEIWRRARLAAAPDFEGRESRRRETFERALAEIQALAHYVPEHWERRRGRV